MLVNVENTKRILDGQYVVYWDHERVFPDGVLDTLKAEAVGDKKRLKHLNKSEGRSRCYISEITTEGEKVEVAVGETLRHGEDAFDRYRGRKFSFRNALAMAGFDKDVREQFWKVFNATWPQGKAVIEVSKVLAFLEKQGVPVSVDVFLAEAVKKCKEASIAVGG